MEIKTLTINGNGFNLPGADSVSYDPQKATKEEQAQARANIGAAKENEPIDYSVYFNIDANGLISLKPEYRGDSPYNENQYPYAISDNGIGMAGSKNSELPEIIVIPDNIDGEEVTGFLMGMFCCNKRVKEITIPKTVKEISGGFVREAIHFEKLTNTEQIEIIGNGAFRQSRIGELICPNLITLGAMVFKDDYCLKRVDLGKIDAIPKSTFEYCANLLEVKADNVTLIADYAFFGTRRLKTIPFQANVKSIGVAAFWNSRCDLEELPSDCTLGDMACYKDENFNTTDYWTGVTPYPCKNSLGSIFCQRDPEWADKEIRYTDTKGTEWVYMADGEPCTYGSNGCGLFVLIEIYSALMGVQFEKPWEIFPILESKSTEETNLLEKDFRTIDGWREMAEGLDLEVTHFTTMTTENLQTVYDALADGALLRKSVAGKFDPNEPNPHSGHVVVGYGINSDGEMLISDTSMHCHDVGIYENHKTAWHIWKQGSEFCNCMIVRKKSV